VCCSEKALDKLLGEVSLLFAYEAEARRTLNDDDTDDEPPWPQ
jgi:hypothetical protein